MRVSGINSSTNFGKVFAVAGDKERTHKLKNILSESEGKSYVINATDVYKNSPAKKGLCSRAARRGKQVSLVVTGTKDLEKVSFMETGWTSIGGISQHIDKFIELHNVKADVKPIQRAMKKDI